MQDNVVDTSEDEWVLLSVQGCLFRLRKETVLNTDWILSKMLTSEVPWTKTGDGQWYVDVDPTSFRIILSILNGVVDLTGGDGDKLSDVDLLLLQATARYLMLDSVVQTAETVKTGHTKAVSEMQEEIVALKEKVTTLEQIEAEEIVALKKKAKTLERIKTALENRPTKVYECRAYRTHRSRNQCGCKTLVFGPLVLSRDDTVSCGECDNDTSRLYGGRQFSSIFEAPSGTDLEDLVNII